MLPHHPLHALRADLVPLGDAGLGLAGQEGLDDLAFLILGQPLG
jgi:hypothetical protein